MPSTKQRPVPERFWEKVDASGDCWEWTASTRGAGYGQFAWGANHHQYPGKIEDAHRVVWRLLIGDIPEGMVVDHLCENTSCVNPDHLQVTTHAVNVTRSGRSPSGQAARKTHCPQRHPLSGDNLRVVSGKRRCKTCDKRRSLEGYYKRKERYAS